MAYNNYKCSLEETYNFLLFNESKGKTQTKGGTRRC